MGERRPWNNGAAKVVRQVYGRPFPGVQQIVKAANPNYRLVLQRAPENILWNAGTNRSSLAARWAFDAYDDHRGAFYVLEQVF